MTATARRPTGNFATRLVSAVVLGPTVLAVAWVGGLAFAALVAVSAGAIVWEWSRICRGRGDDAATIVGCASVVAAVLSVWMGAWMIGGGLVAAGALATGLLSRRDDPARLMWLGVAYAALSAAALVLLRADPEFGRVALFWLLFVVWATDIGGYAAGRSIGGPRLWPAVSPNKTWAGAVGGTAAAVLVGWMFLAVVWPGAAGPAAVLLAAVLSVTAQLGDLGESAFKRAFGVKDSSGLIPGHGGVMDRVDGLVAAAMVAATIGLLRAGPEAAGSGLLIW